MMRRMKFSKSKRGEFAVEEWLEQIPYIVLTAAVMIGIFLLVNYYVNLSVDVRRVESDVLLNRILYSPNSIMYTDDVSGTVYPGIINMVNFTDETLDKSIIYSADRHISAKLEVYDQNKNLVSTAYLSKDWYLRLEPLAENQVSGASSAWVYPATLPIVYRLYGVNFPGFLRVKVIVPN
jgi:hypothetical protein